jgi:putative flippase GtrA
LCTGLQYLLLVLAVEWTGADAALASGAGFAASAVLNYGLNRRYTFGAGQGHGTAIARFVTVVASGLMLTFGGMRLLHGYLGWHYLHAQVLVTLSVLLWNFAWHGLWTFAAPARRFPGN